MRKVNAQGTEQEFGDILRNISQIETIQELKRQLMVCLSPYLTQLEETSVNAKYKALVDTIVDMIQKNYEIFSKKIWCVSQNIQAIYNFKDYER